MDRFFSSADRRTLERLSKMSFATFALATSLALTGGYASGGSLCPPTALILAFDASGSISEEEYILQTKGTALALMDGPLMDLIAAQGGISLSAVIWSDTASGVQIIPWHIVSDGQAMANFAQKVATAPRIPGGNTDIGHGLWHALDLLGQVAGCAPRRLINISGDGRETPHARGRTHVSVAAARTRAEAEGVIINGLAIEDEESDLSGYYEERVKVGPGSFVMEIASHVDFQAAMTRKLYREIHEPVVGEIDRGAGPTLEFSALVDGPSKPVRN